MFPPANVGSAWSGPVLVDGPVDPLDGRIERPGSIPGGRQLGPKSTVDSGGRPLREVAADPAEGVAEPVAERGVRVAGVSMEHIPVRDVEVPQHAVEELGSVVGVEGVQAARVDEDGLSVVLNLGGMSPGSTGRVTAAPSR